MVDVVMMNELHRILEIAAAVLAIPTVVFQIFHYISSFREGFRTKRKSSLAEWGEFKSKWSEVQKCNRFEQELLIGSVDVIQWFSPREVSIIIRHNIDLVTLRNLNYLKKERLIYEDSGKVLIPNSCFIYKYIIFDFLNALLFFYIVLLCVILRFALSSTSNWAEVLFVLFGLVSLITLFILKNNYYTSYRVIERKLVEDKNLSSFICVSSNFDTKKSTL